MKKKIIVFGTAVSAIAALRYYGKENVIGFCDSDSSKSGTLLEGIKIISIDELYEIRNEVRVIIASHSYRKIFMMLAEKGISNIEAYFCITTKALRVADEDWTELLDVKKKLKLSELLPDTNKKKHESIQPQQGKLRVRILVSTLITWNILESVYRAFAADQGCDVSIVFRENYGESKDEKEAYFQKLGIAHIGLREYDAKENRLNILISDMYFGEYEDQDIFKYCEKFVYIPYCIFSFNKEDYDMQKMLDVDCWKIIVNGNIYKDFSMQMPNLVPLGNPKFDSIYGSVCVNSVEYPEEWIQKIKGRKVILWNTMFFKYGEYGTAKFFNFDRWGKSVFDLFDKEKNCVLLFRPHPGLFSSLVDNGIWTHEEYREFLRYLKTSDNIIYDNTLDYGVAYRLSDALMSATSGLLVSYLPLQKPILYMPSYKEKDGLEDKELESIYYRCNTDKDIHDFVKMVLKGEDFMCPLRQEIYTKYFPPFDGKIGIRIKDYLCKEYRKKDEMLLTEIKKL